MTDGRARSWPGGSSSTAPPAGGRLPDAGLLGEADDAVQETWLRLARTDTEEIENLAGWLTTVVARVCLDMLRARRPGGRSRSTPTCPTRSSARGGRPRPGAGGAARRLGGPGAARRARVAEPGRAGRVRPARHVLGAVRRHRPVVDRTPEATRQLASRARRRVEGRPPSPDRDPARQREVVDAFFAAAREGDFDALVEVLHPDVVLRSDGACARP